MVEHVKIIEREQAKKTESITSFYRHIFLPSGPAPLRRPCLYGDPRGQAWSSAERWKMAFKRLDGSPARAIFPRYRGYTPWLLANDVAKGSLLAWYCSLCTRLMVAGMKFVFVLSQELFPPQPQYKFFSYNFSASVTRNFFTLFNSCLYESPDKHRNGVIESICTAKATELKVDLTVRIEMGFRLASQFLLSLTIFFLGHLVAFTLTHTHFIIPNLLFWTLPRSRDTSSPRHHFNAHPSEMLCDHNSFCANTWRFLHLLSSP